MTVNTLHELSGQRERPTGWLWPLLPASLAVFGGSALVYYHLHSAALDPPRSALQATVAAIYTTFGFVPSFMFCLLLLTWSTIWFCTGELERKGTRLLRLLMTTLMLAILWGIRRDGSAPQPQDGAFGVWIGERLVSVLGHTFSSLLMTVLAFGSLLLATDFFFYSYFERARVADAGSDQPELAASGGGPSGSSLSPSQPPVPVAGSGSALANTGVEPSVPDHLVALATTAAAALQESALAATDADEPPRRLRARRWRDAPETEAPAAAAPETGAALPIAAPSVDADATEALADEVGADAPLAAAEPGEAPADEIPVVRRGWLAPIAEETTSDGSVGDLSVAAPTTDPSELGSADAEDVEHGREVEPAAAELAAEGEDPTAWVVGVDDAGEIANAEAELADDDLLVGADAIPAVASAGRVEPDETDDAEADVLQPQRTEAQPVPAAEPEGAAANSAVVADTGADEPIVAIPRPPEGVRQQRLFQPKVDDGLIADAIEVVTSTRRASAAQLQRKLRIDYDLAVDVLQALAARGVIELGAGETQGRVLQQ